MKERHEIGNPARTFLDGLAARTKQRTVCTPWAWHLSALGSALIGLATIFRQKWRFAT